MIFKILLNIILPLWLRRKGGPLTVSDSIGEMGYNPEIIVCKSANSSIVLKKIRAHKPEILLAAGAIHIFKKELIGIPSIGAINLHPSLLPCYAGISPYFWALCRAEVETGGTLHVISTKLDAGNIIDQRGFDLSQITSVLAIMSRIWDINNEMLIDFFKEKTSTRKARAQDPRGRSYFKHPKHSDVGALFRQNKVFYNKEDLCELQNRIEKIRLLTKKDNL